MATSWSMLRCTLTITAPPTKPSTRYAISSSQTHSMGITSAVFHFKLQIRGQGKICILDIDVQGVQTVKKSKLDAKYMFIAPPSIKELENRLRGRGTETAEKIKIRLENAVAELAYSKQEGNFDFVLVNDDLEESFVKIAQVLQGWFPELDLYLG
ncbi:hypothetical protein EON64_08170 [archaeon]|nr:MAG: hypothetical protein EON64_08170 [archaeon]